MDAATDEREERLRFSIDLLDRTGRFVEPANVNLDRLHALSAPSIAPTATQGCVDVLNRLFIRLSTGKPPPPPPVDATDVGAATTTLAGKPKRGKAFKLAQAVESVQARCAGLEERAVALRTQVAQHLAAGQRPKAMVALKRAKAIEKQARQAQATALALENQVDQMENQQMASQVTEALSVAMKSTKRSSKGLLNRAEGALDDAHEMADLVSDVGAMWGELGGGANALDEDEEALEAELSQMLAEERGPAPPPAAVLMAATTKPAPAPVPVPASDKDGALAKLVRAMPTPPKHGTGATDDGALITLTSAGVAT